MLLPLVAGLIFDAVKAKYQDYYSS